MFGLQPPRHIPTLPKLRKTRSEHKGERRPADVIGNAVYVMRIATGHR
jgi:hypothetical protein